VENNIAEVLYCLLYLSIYTKLPAQVITVILSLSNYNIKFQATIVELNHKDSTNILQDSTSSLGMADLDQLATAI